MKNGLKRTGNLLKSGVSYIKSSVSRHPVMYGMPPAIGVELTNHCNLKCPECANGSGLMTREKGFMDPDLYKRFMRDLHPCLFYVSLYFQGESLMHPDFPTFIKGAGSAYTIISTNGHFLTEENCSRVVRSGLRKLIVSLDGIDQTTYSAYRTGGDVERVVNGLDKIVKEKKRERSQIRIEAQILVNRYNEKEIPELKSLCRSLNIPLKLKSMQIINGKDFEMWLPQSESFRRYTLTEGKYILKNPLRNRCSRLWFNPVVTWDGSVLPCCFDKNGEHIMGNLYQDSFYDIWYGTRYRLFRREVLTDRSTIEICRNCTSGLKNVRY
jgi:radical SAM protein with 4Fe4S-binding SPASM domain